jgi:ribosome-binding protein aMBF1 (putative translation factor)
MRDASTKKKKTAKGSKMPKLLNASKDTSKVKTLLGEKISEAMDAKGVSIEDLAREMDITYEHARRLSRGEAVPSVLLLKSVCNRLKLDFTEMNRIAVADKIRQKYGDVAVLLAGRKPDMEGMERLWDKLTHEQKETLTTTAQSLVKQNKTREHA